MVDIISLIQTLGGIAGGFGFGMFTKAGRVKSQADAYKAMAEAYEYRIESLHKIIENNNKTETEHSQRISDLNHALNVKEDELRDKTAIIRGLNEKVYQSEQEVNRVQDLLNDAKDEIIRLTEERDRERARKEYYKQWRCVKSQCQDPEGRRPPNSKLATQTFVDPEENDR